MYERRAGGNLVAVDRAEQERAGVSLMVKLQSAARKPPPKRSLDGAPSRVDGWLGRATRPGLSLSLSRGTGKKRE
jgi:hypothetical protein